MAFANEATSNNALSLSLSANKPARNVAGAIFSRGCARATRILPLALSRHFVIESAALSGSLSFISLATAAGNARWDFRARFPSSFCVGVREDDQRGRERDYTRWESHARGIMARCPAGSERRSKREELRRSLRYLCMRCRCSDSLFPKRRMSSFTSSLLTLCIHGDAFDKLANPKNFPFRTCKKFQRGACVAIRA